MHGTGWDLERLSKETKVSYSRVRPISPLKPRDTITRVTERRMALSADECATTKMAEGINAFVAETLKLEAALKAKL